jgi:hypothetical protein
VINEHSQAIADLIACCLLMRAKNVGERGVLRADSERLLSIGIEECGDWVTDDWLNLATGALAEAGLARSTRDPLGDRFYRIDAGELPALLRKANAELERFERDGLTGSLDVLDKGRFPALDAVSDHPTFERYADFGDEWLKRAIKRVNAELQSNPSSSELTVSDGARPTEPTPAKIALTEATRFELVKELRLVEQAIEAATLTNEEKAQARAFVIAARMLAESPDPPDDLIWELIQRASNLAGIASLFVSIIALFAAAS